MTSLTQKVDGFNKMNCQMNFLLVSPICLNMYRNSLIYLNLTFNILHIGKVQQFKSEAPEKGADKEDL